MVIGADARQTAPRHDADASCRFAPASRIRSHLCIGTFPSSLPGWFSEGHGLEAPSRHLQRDAEHRTGLRLPATLPAAQHEALGQSWSHGMGSATSDRGAKAAHLVSTYCKERLRVNV